MSKNIKINDEVFEDINYISVASADDENVRYEYADKDLVEENSISIVENGTTEYTPSGDNIGFSKVTVDVNVPNKTQTKSVVVTQNSITKYEPSEGYIGFSEFNLSVNVPAPEPLLEEIAVSRVANGKTEYEPTSPNVGFSKVSVNVNVPNGVEEKTVIVRQNGDTEYTPSGDNIGISKLNLTVNVPNSTEEKTISITENGSTEYEPSGDNIGFSKLSVNVNVPEPEPVLETKTINVTENGTTEYTPTSPNVGFDKVNLTVNVPSAETEEKTVDLSMASGNQTIEPTSGKVLSKVTVTKPDTLIAENIKKDIDIGGIIGTLAGGSLPLLNTTSIYFLYVRIGGPAKSIQEYDWYYNYTSKQFELYKPIDDVDFYPLTSFPVEGDDYNRPVGIMYALLEKDKTYTLKTHKIDTYTKYSLLTCTVNYDDPGSFTYESLEQTTTVTLTPTSDQSFYGVLYIFTQENIASD